MFENDYTLTGKHAKYMKFLASKIQDGEQELVPQSTARIFDRYIDVYMNAVVWGLLYRRRAEKDTESKDRARVYADAFANERQNCELLYRMVMLLDDTTDVTTEQRIDRAFRYPSDPEKEKEVQDCMELFNSYARGGIELMFEKFTDGCTTREDYLNKTFEVLKTFKKEIEGISYEEEIRKLIKDYNGIKKREEM